MGMLQKSPPVLTAAPKEYDAQFMNQMTLTLRLFFNDLNAVQALSLAGINLDIGTLPTEAALATLRSGDVYRDTTASHVLKVKP
jgi:hypothetical protein